jgi:DMSO/TMAO reductase YedYZ molybdopterin-dependent catalytic subunit
MTVLEYLTQDPPNAGTPLRLLDGQPLPASEVYMRNNFRLPGPVEGTVLVDLGDRSFSFSPDHFDGRRPVSVDMVLECAGNGRMYMDPVPPGTPWALTGVSPVRFRGVALLDILGAVGSDVDELVFTGADRGHVDPEGEINYQFSLQRSLWDRALLATHLGGAPIPHEHGGPIRLVVPGQYAMKSVKWLTAITAADAPFGGHFVAKYRFFGDTEEPEAAPVGDIRVRSVISHPADGDTLEPGVIVFTGSAWSGAGRVGRVEIGIDGGWTEAATSPGPSPYSATGWSLEAELSPGIHRVSARASDEAGDTQPITPVWNRNGYANNVVQTVDFRVG